MKKALPTTALGLLFCICFSVFTKAQCTLNGVYTINASLPPGPSNFASFNSAVDRLEDCGVSGPVIFNVAEGVYKEQVEIRNIAGANAVNTITFQSDPSNTARPKIEYAASLYYKNFVLNFYQSGYITVRGLELTALDTTLSRVISFENNTSNITIENNILRGRSASRTVSEEIAVVFNDDEPLDRVDSTTIRGNVILGGSYGVFWRSVNALNRETGNVIDSNIIKDFYYNGINSSFQKNIEISYNTVSSSQTTVPSAFGNVTGIWHLHDQNIVCTKNKVLLDRQATYARGIEIQGGEADSADPNILANNMISISGTGYGLSLTDNSWTKVIFNSVLVAGRSSTGLIVRNSANVEILNNNIVNAGDGLAASLSFNWTYPATNVDYNNYYSAGANLLRWNGDLYPDLSALQAASLMDSNSISGDPLFFAIGDLHVMSGLLNNKGFPLPAYPTDIDGEVRSATTPDIGADEYLPLSSDMYVSEGEFYKNSLCLSNSDTIVIHVRNVLGDTADFSIHPMPVHYKVSGPINTRGTLTANVGKLPPLQTAILRATNIDLSSPGIYTLSVWIGPGGTNQMPLNDTLHNAATIEIRDPLKVEPEKHRLRFPGDSVLIRAISPFFSGAGGSGNVTGFTWSSPDGTVLSSKPKMYVGPFPFAGEYKFIASYVSSCGQTYSDTAVIISPPCPEAGPDLEVRVCRGEIDLNDFLAEGANNAGTWVDSDQTGSLSGSIFNTADDGISIGQTYDFRYLIWGIPGCENDTVTISVTVDSCEVSVPDLEVVHKLKVYPNPATRELNVSFRLMNEKKVLVRILDLTGRVVYSHEVRADEESSNYEEKLPLSGLNKGIYLLQVESKTAKITRPVIKE